MIFSTYKAVVVIVIIIITDILTSPNDLNNTLMLGTHQRFHVVG